MAIGQNAPNSIRSRRMMSPRRRPLSYSNTKKLPKFKRVGNNFIIDLCRGAKTFPSFSNHGRGTINLLTRKPKLLGSFPASFRAHPDTYGNKVGNAARVALHGGIGLPRLSVTGYSTLRASIVAPQRFRVIGTFFYPVTGNFLRFPVVIQPVCLIVTILNTLTA